MLVFKEVRKEYLKKAALVAVCLWAVVVAAIAVISVINGRNSVARGLVPDADTVSSAIGQAADANSGGAVALDAVQKSLPGNFGSESEKIYGASVVADGSGNVLWASESYLLLTGDDGAQYYVPLEGYLTNEQIAQVESLFTEQPRYSNAMGSDAGSMYDIEMVADCTFEGAVITGYEQGGMFIPVSMDAYQTSGESTTVFERQDEAADTVQVTVSSGEMAIRSTGPRAQTSDNLARTQACTEKAEALASEVPGNNSAKAGGKYQTAVTPVQAGGKTYYVVSVGYADLGLIVKNAVIQPLSPILLFLLLAVAAYAADSKARKKTGKNSEPPGV